MSNTKIAIRTEGLTKNFGSLVAVDHVTMDIPEKQIRAIIGPNGAGKSTLMDLISNRTMPSEGKVFLNDEDITGLPPYVISRKGLGKCFQISRLFTQLTALENIQVSIISREKQMYNFFGLHTGPGHAAYREEAEALLESIGIVDKRSDVAGFMSYGDQRRLEIGITLAQNPHIIMLDEPTAGVARSEGYKLMDLCRDLARQRELTIVFIEHDMDIVFNYAEEISVMSHGKLIASGTPEQIRNDTFVQQSYLGA